MITRTQLLALVANDAFLDSLNETIRIFRIVNQAAFLAQLIHESNGFKSLSENLNYSPAGLMATWPSRFNQQLANRYGRVGAQPADQEAIANIAYANRMGNGPASTGDGWRYRGRGPIQITGKDNYTAAGESLGLDFVGNPSQLLLPRQGCLAAGWFWSKSRLDALVDIDKISQAINGGKIGLAERRVLYEKIRKVLS